MTTRDTDIYTTVRGHFMGYNEDVLVEATVHDEDEQPWTLQVAVTKEGIVLNLVNPSDGEVAFARGQTFQEIADEMVESGQ